MAKAVTKMRLRDLLFDPEFIDTSSDIRDTRKKYRAKRKRRIRETELRVRREHAIRKRLGIK